MDIIYDHTCWYGLDVKHPIDWEATTLSVGKEVHECVFSDPYQERLKLQWRQLSYTPKLEKLLEKRVEEQEEGEEVEPLENIHKGWRGTVTRGSDYCIIHAGKFFENCNVFVEAVILWPSWRNIDLEKMILSSMAASSLDGIVTWNAMGINLRLDSSFRLESYKSQVGKVEFKFNHVDNKKTKLEISRIGIPKYWLKTSVENWLESQLPSANVIQTRALVDMNGHNASRLFSLGRCKGVDYIAGRKNPRLDIAWHCHAEDRVYHVRYETIRGTDSKLDLPESFFLKCCKEVNKIWRTEESVMPRGKRRKRKKKFIGASEIMDAIPFKNTKIKEDRGSRGGCIVQVPMRKPRWLIPPISWIIPFSDYKNVKLDLLGVEIYDKCDGKKTVAKIIEEFAVENLLSYREAQVPVFHFIQMLTERGVVAIVKPENKTKYE